MASFTPPSISAPSISVPTSIEDLWPNISFSLPPLPSAADAQSFYTGALDELQRMGGVSDLLGAGIDMLASQAGSVLSSVAGAASLATGPAGPLIAFGGSMFGGVLKGLFGGNEDPPARTIGGEDSQEFQNAPFGNADRAVIAAGLLNGDVKTSAKTLEGALSVIRTSLQGALEGVGRDDFTPSSPNYRATAYFCATVNYKHIFNDVSMFGRPELRKQLGKLLAWGAPRVRMRSVLVNWWYYKQAKRYYEFRDGNCSRSAPPAFAQVSDDEHEQYVIQRAACLAADNGYAAYLNVVRELALPNATKAVDGAWSYMPWSAALVEGELRNYYSAGLGSRVIYDWLENRRFRIFFDEGYSKAFADAVTEAKKGRLGADRLNTVTGNISAMNAEKVKPLMGGAKFFVSKLKAPVPAATKTATNKAKGRQKAADRMLAGALSGPQWLGVAALAGAAGYGAYLLATKKKKR